MCAAVVAAAAVQPLAPPARAQAATETPPAAGTAAAGVPAAPPATGTLSVELGAGSERLSSPLIRLSPDGTLVFVDGLTRIDGSFRRVVVSGVRDVPLGDSTRMTVGGRLDEKSSPDAPDLGFRFASLDAIVRRPAGGGTLGIGPSLQRIWVAGRHFRDVAALHVDWTRVEPERGYTAWVAELGTNRHRGVHADLDGNVLAVSTHRKSKQPFPWLDGLDFDAGVRREVNANGFADLASRSAWARVSADRRFAGATWSVGAMLQRAWFDAALFDDTPARRDRYRLLDAAVEIELAPRRTLRVEAIDARNSSTLALYENRYRLVGVTLTLGW